MAADSIFVQHNSFLKLPSAKEEQMDMFNKTDDS